MVAAPAPGGRPCPCGRLDGRGRPLVFAACCGRYIGHADCPAPDAESLMRSRYSAYVLGDAAYLQATWHARTRPPTMDANAAGARWLGLQVHDARGTGEQTAEVEFTARWRDASGRGQRMRERSRFVQEQGRWYYVDGDVA
ncbi:YchJ family metal-binding protein [Comamonas faecalis]|uniref:YchJ family metal-binding protein n=1 Tax=Comamonas faecalis TaxID=1387849 RepID=A0ABP7RB52_9BURK